MMKLKVVSRSFTNAPKNKSDSHYVPFSKYVEQELKVQEIILTGIVSTRYQNFIYNTYDVRIAVRLPTDATVLFCVFISFIYPTCFRLS